MRRICSPIFWMRNRREGIFDISEFLYDEKSDTCTCPAGQRLERRKHKKRRVFEYIASGKTCAACELHDQCTRNKNRARTIKRHLRQKELDQMRRIAQSPQAKRDLKTRKHFMERSYADAANNHGFKRSRWRGLEKVTIQNLLIAAVQNIRILIGYWRKPVGVAQENRIAAQEMLKNIAQSVGETLVLGRWHLLHLSWAF